MADEQIGNGQLRAIGVVEIQDAPDLAARTIGIAAANGLVGYEVDLTLEAPIAEDEFVPMVARVDGGGLCAIEWRDENTVRISSTDTNGDPAAGNVAFEIVAASLQEPPVSGP